MLTKFNNFKDDNILHFLLEKRGISNICFEYRDILKADINEFITDFYNSNGFATKRIFENNKSYFYNLDDTTFKIDNLILNISLFKYSENLCEAVCDFSKSLMNNNILDSPIINMKIYINNLNEDFIFKINSILLHEIVHVYEKYNLNLNKKIRPQYWSIGSIYPQLRNRYHNKDVQNILYLLYLSLKNEIASLLHQYYDYKKHGKKYDNIAFIIDKLTNFSVKNISEEFISEIDYVRQHIYNSIKYFSTNKYYLKHLNKSIWNNEINPENVNNFIIELSEIFNKSVKHIQKKIKMINTISNEINYSDYDNMLNEKVLINGLWRTFPILDLYSY